MKKIISLVMAFALAMSMSITAFAAGEPQTTTTIEDWGNGFTAVVTTTITDGDAATRATNTKNTNRTWQIYKGSTSVGSVSLYVTFKYNGSSAQVEDYSTGHSVKSGWSYGSESVRSIGGKCTISGTFTGSGSVSFSKSISCSPTGSIS